MIVPSVVGDTETEARQALSAKGLTAQLGPPSHVDGVRGGHRREPVPRGKRPGVARAHDLHLARAGILHLHHLELHHLELHLIDDELHGRDRAQQLSRHARDARRPSPGPGRRSAQRRADACLEEVPEQLVPDRG